jgi:hypothetical protein
MDNFKHTKKALLQLLKKKKLESLLGAGGSSP